MILLLYDIKSNCLNENQLVVCASRCTSVAWIPGRDGAFVVAHADGNVYVYEKASLRLSIFVGRYWPSSALAFMPSSALAFILHL